MSEIVATERIGRVAVIRLDRPRANALSLELLAELEVAIAALAENLPGAIVVRGTERIFSAGADITEFGGTERAAEVAGAFARALDALAALPRATIAAIAGVALGGGLELALACDFRFVAEGARLGQPEVLLGLIPGGGGTQRLARLVGPARAKELVFTGRELSAEDALATGLADRVVPADRLFEATMEFASELASGAVVAHGLAKRAIDEGFDLPLASGLALERELFVQVFETRDAEIGVRAFLERKPAAADFIGR